MSEPLARATRGGPSEVHAGGSRQTQFHATDPRELRLSVSAIVWRDARGRAGGELLLMQRADSGHWGLPGGYVELGESVSRAVAREVLEETGVRIDVGRLVGVYSDPGIQVIAYPDGRRVQAVNLCFEAIAVGSEAPTTPHETLETGYFRADALPEPFVPIHGVRVADALAGGEAARIR
jgi:ADP-ribose pyrophosphatase YjhB (NUDIX family)